MLLDEASALLCPLCAILEAALPLQHGPAVIAVLGQLAEDLFEIDLAVSQRTEAAGTLDPVLVAAINA